MGAESYGLTVGRYGRVVLWPSLQPTPRTPVLRLLRRRVCQLLPQDLVKFGLSRVLVVMQRVAKSTSSVAALWLCMTRLVACWLAASGHLAARPRLNPIASRQCKRSGGAGESAPRKTTRCGPSRQLPASQHVRRPCVEPGLHRPLHGKRSQSYRHPGRLGGQSCCLSAHACNATKARSRRSYQGRTSAGTPRRSASAAVSV